MLPYIYIYPWSITKEQIAREGRIVYGTKMLTPRYHLNVLQYLKMILYDSTNEIIVSISLFNYTTKIQAITKTEKLQMQRIKSII